MAVVGAGCATKNDSLSGSGGAPGTGGHDCHQSDSCGGTTGTGGLSQSGGAPGTGGGTGGADPSGLQAALTAAEATWAAAKPNCPIYVYQTRRSSVFGSCTISTYEIANDRLIRSAYVSYDSRGCSGNVTGQGSAVGAQLPDAGVPPTVEQLFSTCQTLVTEIEANPSGYSGLGFGYDAQGVPESCVANVVQCVDDCTDGIDVQGFMCEASPSFDAGLTPG
jgi:hypothetical protein